MRPKIEAILRDGVNSKGDLKAALAQRHQISVSLNTLNGWLTRLDLQEVFRGDGSPRYRLTKRAPPAPPSLSGAAASVEDRSVDEDDDEDWAPVPATPPKPRPRLDDKGILPPDQRPRMTF